MGAQSALRRVVAPSVLSPATHDAAACKVVFVVGATGTGKSRLAIDLAAHFGGEVINSDKIQVHRGLDITTNKVTPEECGDVPHHLLGTIRPDEEFDVSDFRRCATELVESILARGRLPVIAGGSNSFIEALVEGENRRFRSKYECCFLWVDVSLPVLDDFVSDRVDRMVEGGMIEEVRGMFDPDDTDYSKGIRRSIGFPEIDRFLRKEITEAEAIIEIKANTCKLARKQLDKIKRLRGLPGWEMKRLDATDVFLRRKGDKEEMDEAWDKLVANPCIDTVVEFLGQQNHRHVDNHHRDATKEYCIINKDVKAKRTTTTPTATTATPFFVTAAGAAVGIVGAT